MINIGVNKLKAGCFYVGVQKQLLFWGMAVSLTGLYSCTNMSNSTRTDNQVAIKSTKKTFQELGFFGRIKENKWYNFVSAVQNNIGHSRKESGNLAFSLYQLENGEQEALWFERFKTKADHNQHKEQNYFKHAIAVIQQSLAGDANSIELKELTELPVQNPLQSNQPSQSRTVVVLFDVKPKKRDQFIKAMKQATTFARKASGNLEFNVYQYLSSANQFVLIETWATKSAYEANQSQKYSKQVDKAFDGLFNTDPMNTRWVLKDISISTAAKQQ